MRSEETLHLDHAEDTMYLAVTEAARRVGQLMPSPQEVPHSIRHVYIHKAKRCGR